MSKYVVIEETKTTSRKAIDLSKNVIKSNSKKLYGEKYLRYFRSKK